MTKLFRYLRNIVSNAFYTEAKRDMDFEEGKSEASLGINPCELAKMRDHQLARWQAQFAPQMPQYILAAQEWQNRRLAKQIRATYFASIIAIVGALVGVVLGWQLKSIRVPETPIHKSQPKTPSTKTHQQNQPGTKLYIKHIPTPVNIPPSPCIDRDERKTKRNDTKEKEPESVHALVPPPVDGKNR